MQPAFLPWVGYMGLLDRADIFILLDTVAVDRQSWQTRNRIRGRDGSVVWLSVPVHAHMGQPLSDVKVVAGSHWKQKHLRTIRAAYGHTPGWATLEELLAHEYQREWGLLTNLNGSLIQAVADYLGVTTPILHACELGETRDDKVGRIVDLCHAVGADTYLSTTGSSYLKEQDLEGLALEWYDHTPTPYVQDRMEWQPYLSVIDTIAHCHTDTLAVIRNAYDQPCETRKQSENN